MIGEYRMSGKYKRFTEEEKKNNPDEYFLNEKTGKYNKIDKKVKKVVKEDKIVVKVVKDDDEEPLLDDGELDTKEVKEVKEVKHKKETEIVIKINKLVINHLAFTAECEYYLTLGRYGLKLEQNADKYFNKINKLASDISSYMRSEKVKFFVVGKVIVSMSKEWDNNWKHDVLAYKRIGDKEWTALTFFKNKDEIELM